VQDGEYWKLNKDIIDLVKFEYFNLLDSVDGLGKFDVVFCRNVLIYFDIETKKQVLDKISSILAPDGVILLGGSESVFGISDSFAPIEGVRGIYCKQDCQDSLAG